MSVTDWQAMKDPDPNKLAAEAAQNQKLVLIGYFKATGQSVAFPADFVAVHSAIIKSVIEKAWEHYKHHFGGLTYEQIRKLDCRAAHASKFSSGEFDYEHASEQPCGHGVDQIASSDEGTNYCKACEAAAHASEQKKEPYSWIHNPPPSPRR